MAPPVSKAAHNEQVKLTAGLLNNIATATAVSAVVLPVISASYYFADAPATLADNPVKLLVKLATCAVWLLWSQWFHRLARRVVGRVRE